MILVDFLIKFRNILRHPSNKEVGEAKQFIIQLEFLKYDLHNSKHNFDDSDSYDCFTFDLVNLIRLFKGKLPHPQLIPTTSFIDKFHFLRLPPIFIRITRVLSFPIRFIAWYLKLKRLLKDFAQFCNKEGKYKNRVE